MYLVIFLVKMIWLLTQQLLHFLQKVRLAVITFIEKDLIHVVFEVLGDAFDFALIHGATSPDPHVGVLKSGGRQMLRGG